MKAFKYVLGYLLIMQLVIPYLLPFNIVFKERMDYNLVKDNLENIDVILQEIGLQIKREKLQDYIIILGDSIAYSGPGNSDQSIGHYMQNLARESSTNNPPRIYNLAMPAMQNGDIYTMLLMLDKHQISTDNVIINVDYKGFIKRQPDPPIVLWLKDDLKDLDPTSFNWALANLKANHYKDQMDWQSYTHRLVVENVEMFRFRDFIKKGLKGYYRYMTGAQPIDDSIGDASPWFEKKGLKEILSGQEYQNEFSDLIFDMTDNNPQIYFMEKIIAHQKDKRTLVFLAAANEKLMHEQVTKAGYRDNLQLIDNYFQAQPLSYLNVYGKISSDLFSDHMHLTAEGYRQLAKLLWDNLEIGVNS